MRVVARRRIPQRPVRLDRVRLDQLLLGTGLNGLFQAVPRRSRLLLDFRGAAVLVLLVGLSVPFGFLDPGPHVSAGSSGVAWGRRAASPPFQVRNTLL